MSRALHELYGRHGGETMWIAGSDPSLSGYPDDFFEGKTSLTLHLAHKKFPDATWRYSSEYDRSEQLMLDDPRYRRLPLIAALPMYGQTIARTKALIGEYDQVYFHRMVNYLPTGVRGEVDRKFTGWKVKQAIAGRARIFGGHGSCLHTAIYAALTTGAKAINLIGAGHGMYKPEVEHFQEVLQFHYDKRPNQGSFANSKVRVPIIRETMALIDACRDAGVEFTWHRTWTPGMDDRIVIDQDWLAEEIQRAATVRPLSQRLYWMLLKRPVHRVIGLF